MNYIESIRIKDIMGYRTSYFIITDHLDPTSIDVVRKNIDKLREMSEKTGDKDSYVLDWEESGWSGNSYEWDNYYGDMLELSEACPNIRLTIRGEGEETEDI